LLFGRISVVLGLLFGVSPGTRREAGVSTPANNNEEEIEKQPARRSRAPAPSANPLTISNALFLPTEVSCVGNQGTQADFSFPIRCQ
jgi:hypothetical protein